MLMERCQLLDEAEGKMSYKISHGGTEPFQLVITHRFSKVNTCIESLLYYITVNGDRTYNSTPELLSTSRITDEVYTSVYMIPNVIGNAEDDVKLILVLPFDHKLSIIDVGLTTFFHLSNNLNVPSSDSIPTT